MKVSVIVDFGFGDEVMKTFDDFDKASKFQQRLIKKYKNKTPSIEEPYLLQSSRLHIESF